MHKFILPLGKYTILTKQMSTTFHQREDMSHRKATESNTTGTPKVKCKRLITTSACTISTLYQNTLHIKQDFDFSS